MCGYFLVFFYDDLRERYLGEFLLKKLRFFFLDVEIIEFRNRKGVFFNIGRMILLFVFYEGFFGEFMDIYLYFMDVEYFLFWDYNFGF